MQMNEDKPMFRVGGVYRDGEDSVLELRACPKNGFAACHMVRFDGHVDKYGTGICRLSDGRDDAALDRESLLHLIPGELELRDGQWVPVEEKEEAKPDDFVWLLGPLEPIGDDYDEGDADAAMIARDGPAKPAAVVIEQPARTAKPALPALSISTDLQPASHQVRAAFGSADLLKD
jgi:hypothetical protein